MAENVFVINVASRFAAVLMKEKIGIIYNIVLY
jgi:hypothetical protein